MGQEGRGWLEGEGHELTLPLPGTSREQQERGGGQGPDCGTGAVPVGQVTAQA